MESFLIVIGFALLMAGTAAALLVANERQALGEAREVALPVGFALAAAGWLLAIAVTASFALDERRTECGTHAFWNSGWFLLIPVLAIAALVSAYVGRTARPFLVRRAVLTVLALVLLGWCAWVFAEIFGHACWELMGAGGMWVGNV